LYINGLGDGIADHLDVLKETRAERYEFLPHIVGDLIPLMNDGSGSHYCLVCRDGGHDFGKVVYWAHDDPAGANQVPEVVAASFEQWVASMLA